MKNGQMKGFIPMMWLIALVVGPLLSSAAAQETLAQKTSEASRKVVKFISGKEQDDLSLAKQLYGEGDDLFRRASEQKGADARKLLQLQPRSSPSHPKLLRARLWSRTHCS